MVGDATAPWEEIDLGPSPVGYPEGAGALTLRAASGELFELVSVRVRGALALGAEAFEQAVTRAYLALAGRLGKSQARHPVRLWNFIPGILVPLADLPHRYMVFNTGRLEGYRRWLCSGSGFWQAIPTATGVGHDGEDFVLHGLAAQHPGVPIENPRQRPAYRYSKRYGPRPPCFARATRLEQTPSGRPWLLVGGTASVVGEQTVHGDDLDRQIDETLRNLSALVRAADPSTPGEPPLHRFRQLRVYHPEVGEGEQILDRLGRHFPAVEQIERQPATLCRPDLRVEIEGLVE